MTDKEFQAAVLQLARLPGWLLRRMTSTTSKQGPCSGQATSRTPELTGDWRRGAAARDSAGEDWSVNGAQVPSRQKSTERPTRACDPTATQGAEDPRYRHHHSRARTNQHSNTTKPNSRIRTATSKETRPPSHERGDNPAGIRTVRRPSRKGRLLRIPPINLGQERPVPRHVPNGLFRTPHLRSFMGCVGPGAGRIQVLRCVRENLGAVELQALVSVGEVRG